MIDRPDGSRESRRHSAETTDGFHVKLRYELVCILFIENRKEHFAEKSINFVEISDMTRYIIYRLSYRFNRKVHPVVEQV